MRWHHDVSEKIQLAIRALVRKRRQDEIAFGRAQLGYISFQICSHEEIAVFPFNASQPCRRKQKFPASEEAGYRGACAWKFSREALG